ncbi:MAG: arylsulfatase, partial [Pirellulales bacterium]|nr:arylsulfatase [Pirellulales bacterium]
ADTGEDSVSFMPLLGGQDRDVRTVAVNQSMQGMLSIRRGPWKLIFGRGSGGWTKGATDKNLPPGQLYNLDDDLAETTNLYADRPEIVTQLNALMQRLIDTGRGTPGPAQKNDGPVKWKSLR